VGVFVISDSIELRVLSGVYGVAALIAGVAIWQQRSWAAIAFAAWSCIALATGIAFDVTLNLGPTSKGAVFVLAIGSLLCFVYRYVRKRAIVGA